MTSANMTRDNCIFWVIKCISHSVECCFHFLYFLMSNSSATSVHNYFFLRRKCICICFVVITSEIFYFEFLLRFFPKFLFLSAKVVKFHPSIDILYTFFVIYFQFGHTNICLWKKIIKFIQDKLSTWNWCKIYFLATVTFLVPCNLLYSSQFQ